MSEHPDQQFQEASRPVDPSAPAQDQGRSRRRLLKAGLAAVPLVLTLRGRPAQAGTPNGSPGGGVVTGADGSTVSESEESPSFLDSPSSDSSTWSRSSWTSDESTGGAAEGESY